MATKFQKKVLKFLIHIFGQLIVKLHLRDI